MHFSTTAERGEMKSNHRAKVRKHSWKLAGAAEHLKLTVAKNALNSNPNFVGSALNFKVCMLKGTVTS